jgi:hypothetical protein
MISNGVPTPSAAEEIDFKVAPISNASLYAGMMKEIRSVGLTVIF